MMGCNAFIIFDLPLATVSSFLSVDMLLLFHNITTRQPGLTK